MGKYGYREVEQLSCWFEFLCRSRITFDFVIYILREITSPCFFSFTLLTEL